jgi:hypothetical protein
MAGMNLERDPMGAFLAVNVSMLGSVRSLPSLLRTRGHLFHHLIIVSQHHGPNFVYLVRLKPGEQASQCGIEGGDTVGETQITDEEAPNNLSRLPLVYFHQCLKYRA